MPAKQGVDQSAHAMMLYDAGKKSIVVAVLLLMFFGAIGGHRFYLGRIAPGLVMLAMTLVGWVLAFVITGWPILFVVGLWWLLDLIRISGMVRQQNERLVARIARPGERGRA